METARFYRKPFEVDAVQVTAENMAEVAQWCKGTVVDDPKSVYIKVDVPNVINDRQTKAFAGDWVLYAGTGFKVYTPKAFEKSFSPVDETSEEVEDQAS